MTMLPESTISAGLIVLETVIYSRLSNCSLMTR